MTRPHPLVAASVLGALLFGLGWLLVPRAGAVPSTWPPPWGSVWAGAVLVAAVVTAVGLALTRPTSVTGWLVERAGHVMLGGLHCAFTAAAAIALGWAALDTGVIAAFGAGHLWLAWQMGRDLQKARDATDPPELT